MFVMKHTMKYLRHFSREELNYDEFISEGEVESSDYKSGCNKDVFYL